MGYAGSELHHKDLEHEDEGVEISVGVEVTEVIGGRFRDPTLRASKHYDCRSSA